MSDAPFCNVKGTVVVPGQSVATVLQPVPKATDLSSLIKAVAALTNNFNALNGQIVNQSFSSGAVTKQDPSKKPAWIEDRGARVVEKVKVFNPDDESQFVEVEQIKSFTMKNAKTGEIFKWQR